MHIIDIFLCILFYILNCILCTLYILHIVHNEHIFLHIASGYACPRQYISCILFDILCIYSTYLLTCFACWIDNILCIYCIFVNIFLYDMHIMHIMHIVLFWSYFAYFEYKSHSSVFRCYSHYCLIPHPRAQLFTYHHLHPSPLFWLLSQEAPGT